MVRVLYRPLETKRLDRPTDGCGTLFRHKWCAHAFEQARGGAWYAMEQTELLPHVVRALNINWDEATRYVGLNPEV